MRRFEFVEGNSSKFWSLKLSESTITVRWGRIGTKGQEKVTEFDSNEEAEAAMSKLITEKMKKGYEEVECSAFQDDFPPEYLELARTTYLPVTEVVDKHDLEVSRFGGLPLLHKSEPWPKCGQCDGQLSHILQLNLSKLPAKAEGLPSSGVLQIFYCVKDDDVCKGGWEAFSNMHCCRIIPEAEVASLTLGDPRPDVKELEGLVIRSWDKVDRDFPHPSDIEMGNFDIDEDDLEAAIEASLEMPHWNKHKLLGWPAFQQEPEYPNCSICSTKMIFLFQITSEGDMLCLHDGTSMVYYCKNHPDIVAFNWAR